MSETNLDELARSARRGGRVDTERFLDALRPLVARWALVLTGSPDTAEDVAQAVLLRVLGSLSTYRPSGKIQAWVYRITWNVAADEARKDQRDQTRLDRLAAEHTANWFQGGPDALEALAARELLKSFVTRLSPQQRAVLDLVELQGFSAAEAAEMLEISPATVRVHLHRAKAAMSQAATEQAR